MSKKALSESDICDQYITPAIVAAGWDKTTQIRREFGFTAGRIIVRGQLAVRGQRKRADYVLFSQPHVPIAVIEAKDNNHPVGGGMQQALAYAEALDVPFVFSSNGDAFSFHDRTGLSHPVERSLSLHEFPTPDALWSRYCAWKGLSDDAEKLVRFPYHDDGSGKGPRYYQRIAIQRTIEAIARGEGSVAGQLLQRGLEWERRRGALPTYNDLDALAGTWSEDKAAAFLQTVASFEHIDPALRQRRQHPCC